MEGHVWSLLIWSFFTISGLQSQPPIALLRRTPVAEYVKDQLVIDCQFSNRVTHCLYLDNGMPVDPIFSGFSYKNGLNGIDTFDCTLILSAPGMSSTDDLQKQSKDLLCVGIQKLIPKVVKLGEQVQLSCSSNRPINCDWFRKVNRVPIAGDYQYIHRGVNTTDCSIKIRSIKSFDLTSWDCRGGETGSDILVKHFLTTSEIKQDDFTSDPIKKSTEEQDNMPSVWLILSGVQLFITILVAVALLISCKRNHTQKKEINTISPRVMPALPAPPSNQSGPSTTNRFVVETDKIYSPLYEKLTIKPKQAKKQEKARDSSEINSDGYLIPLQSTGFPNQSSNDQPYSHAYEQIM